jgi:predicted metal-dependent hydrolase
MNWNALFDWLSGNHGTTQKTSPRDSKSKVQHTSLKVGELTVPVRIHRESRISARASLGKEAAILRLPLRLPEKEELRLWKWFEDWVLRQFSANPVMAERFKPKLYLPGDTLRVGSKTYRLSIESHSGSGHSGRLRGDLLHLRLSNHEQDINLQRSVRTLLSRLVGKDQLPMVVERVHCLNDQHFNQTFKTIRLKYNHSNWGSCSRSGNINLSTRLLFAPQEIQDYVIIHELAHLIEFNHSPRYWALVAKADPNYKHHVEWLNRNGHSCDF